MTTRSKWDMSWREFKYMMLGAGMGLVINTCIEEVVYSQEASPAVFIEEIFDDGFETGNTSRWSPEIFSDGFESGDVSAWSSTTADEPWPEPHAGGRRFQGVCVQLTISVTEQVGKPPLEVCWDIGQDGVCDMFTEIRSTTPAEINRQAAVEWTPTNLGEVLVGFELSNPWGTARSSFRYDVRDPDTHGGCCQPDGSCLDVATTTECGDLSLGSYCSQLDCTPIPAPTWSAVCRFGSCAWSVGERITFTATNAFPPWRYAWLTPATAVGCGTFGPLGPVQPTHALPVGSWRPCAEMKDGAGRVVRIRESRELQVFP